MYVREIVCMRDRERECLCRGGGYREREREKEKGRDRERESESEREKVCVCVCGARGDVLHTHLCVPHKRCMFPYCLSVICFRKKSFVSAMELQILCESILRALSLGGSGTTR